MSLEIRPARADDYAAYVRLFGELGIFDPVPGPARFADTIAQRMRIAARDGAVLGFISWRPYGTVAHVVQISVDPHVRGQRVGELLLEDIRGLARAAGCLRWYLNVKRDNTSALRLYERVGFAFELEAFAIKIPWSAVPRVAVHAALAEPALDAALAAQFHVPVERLATLRARSLRIVVLRDDADAVIGFAAFDPGFPGAPLAHATSPALAPALLEALRPHALPEHDFVHVTVEGDRPLADAMLALGGTLSFELLRLGAAL